MVDDSAYDTLDWHEFLLAAGVVPVAPYKGRNTDDPKDIKYRVGDRIEEYSEEVQLKQSMLDGTYNHQLEVERTNSAVKDCGLDMSALEGAPAHERRCIIKRDSIGRR